MVPPALLLGFTTVVPQMARAQSYSVLYNFTGGADGGQPWSNLMMDAAGNLYGTTTIGGDLTCRGFGCGVVFKIGLER